MSSGRTTRKAILGYSHVCDEPWRINTDAGDVEITTEGGTFVTGIICHQIAMHIVATHNAVIAITAALPRAD